MDTKDINSEYFEKLINMMHKLSNGIIIEDNRYIGLGFNIFGNTGFNYFNLWYDKTEGFYIMPKSKMIFPKDLIKFQDELENMQTALFEANKILNK